MELHKFKKLDFSFGIIAPEQNIGAILCTVRSIRNNFPNIPFICAVPRNTKADVVKEITGTCPVYKGKNTITSLINAAIRRGGKDWNLLVMEGAIVRGGIIKKYSLFIEEETDVLFPITMEYNRKGEPHIIITKFPDASLNGMFIHQKLFRLAGDFSDSSSIADSKFIWAAQAQEHGAKFKAVLGAKLL